LLIVENSRGGTVTFKKKRRMVPPLEKIVECLAPFLDYRKKKKAGNRSIPGKGRNYSIRKTRVSGSFREKKTALPCRKASTTMLAKVMKREKKERQSRWGDEGKAYFRVLGQKV